MKWTIEFSKSFIVEITGIRVIMFLSNDMTKHIAFYNGKQVYCIFLNQLVVTPLLCPWLVEWSGVPSPVWLFVAAWTIAHQALLPWKFPGKNTGVGCCFLFQRIFSTQPVSPALAGGFFISVPPYHKNTSRRKTVKIMWRQRTFLSRGVAVWIFILLQKLFWINIFSKPWFLYH